MKRKRGSSPAGIERNKAVNLSSTSVSEISGSTSEMKGLVKSQDNEPQNGPKRQLGSSSTRMPVFRFGEVGSSSETRFDSILSTVSWPPEPTDFFQGSLDDLIPRPVELDNAPLLERSRRHARRIRRDPRSIADLRHRLHRYGFVKGSYGDGILSALSQEDRERVEAIMNRRSPPPPPKRRRLATTEPAGGNSETASTMLGGTIAEERELDILDHEMVDAEDQLKDQQNSPEKEELGHSDDEPSDASHTVSDFDNYSETQEDSLEGEEPKESDDGLSESYVPSEDYDYQTEDEEPECSDDEPPDSDTSSHLAASEAASALDERPSVMTLTINVKAKSLPPNTTESDLGNATCDPRPEESELRRKQATKLFMANKIRQMMYVSGETAEPSVETTSIIEDIVRQQVIEMVSLIISLSWDTFEDLVASN
jgi:hypothetical protein